MRRSRWPTSGTAGRTRGTLPSSLPMTLSPRLRMLFVVPVLALTMFGCGTVEPTQAPRRVVSVEGRTDEVIEAGVFVLADAGGDAGDVLLVVDRRRAAVEPGERVRVSGELRAFRSREVAQLLRRSADEARLVRFEGTTYVEARRVERLLRADD